jgi:hypothetical protein
LVILPLDRWSRITEKGLRFALKISDEVQADAGFGLPRTCAPNLSTPH